MRILDRYLVRGFVGPFVYCMTLFTILFVVIDTFDKLDEFLKAGIQPAVVLTYYLYLLPTLLWQIVPVAVLVAVLYKLGNLSKHNEITALRASGVSSFQILLPYLFTGLLISFAMFLLGETAMPKTSVTSTSIKEGVIEKGRKNLADRSIKNVTLYAPGGRMVFAREFVVQTGTLHDVVILQDGEDHSLQSKLTAKKAVYEDEKWVFHDTIRYALNAKGDLVGEPQLDKRLELDLEEKPIDFLRGSSQVDFMSAGQLKSYIENFRGNNRRAQKRLWVDFHNKIAFPFVSFVVMLIGAPLAMRTERAGAFVGIGTGLVVVMLYYAVNSVCLAIGKGGHLPAFVAAWLANFLFAAAGLYLIRKAA